MWQHPIRTVGTNNNLKDQQPATVAIAAPEDGGPLCATADLNASEGFGPLQKHRKPQVFVYVCTCDSGDSGVSRPFLWRPFHRPEVC